MSADNFEANMILEVVSPHSGLVDDAHLDVIGPTDLITGAELVFQFTGGLTKFGKVIKVDSYGARIVIESEGRRWWLERRITINVIAVNYFPWVVGGVEP